jgi:cysteinyl-tRNA synthetase
MAIRIYNTLTRRKEPFVPRESGKVSMYVCGPTVYDACHIGHARSVVVFDVIASYFKVQGFDLTYVRNFTDIDDKIIERATQLGISTSQLSNRFIDEFHTDMDALNVERPTHEPRATDYISNIITVIKKLIGKGVAYKVDGDVYFKVDAFEGYGKLSGRKLEDMEAGARIEVDSRKQNPFDFALWKSAKPGEPSWDSPWSQGRPGWHIECSAMSSQLLGENFDIHGGGKDLIFPHHENEIAQSEAAFGEKFANYWIHNGFVNINHEKMSKSLGNFKLVKEVLDIFHPEVVRLFLLSHHYRNPIDFNDQTMIEAEAGLDKLYAGLARLTDVLGEDMALEPPRGSGETWEKFTAAMDDDFNTAKGIGILFETVRQLNRHLDEQPEALEENRARLAGIYHDIKTTGRVLGIFNQSPKDYFDNKRKQAAEAAHTDTTKIEQLINEREEARKTKNWARADQIRDELQAMNVILEDRSGGTLWRIG